MTCPLAGPLMKLLVETAYMYPPKDWLQPLRSPFSAPGLTRTLTALALVPLRTRPVKTIAETRFAIFKLIREGKFRINESDDDRRELLRILMTLVLDSF